MPKFSNSTESQKKRLLVCLKRKPITTIEARHKLDILAVAARIFELRHCLGYNIKTFWKYAKNPGGGEHRVANYVLMPGKFKKGGTRHAKQ